jgi:hypothetical protein
VDGKGEIVASPSGARPYAPSAASLAFQPSRSQTYIEGCPGSHELRTPRPSPTLLLLITTHRKTIDLIKIMKQHVVGLTVVALASAAVVSAQAPSSQGALVISRASFA